MTIEKKWELVEKTLIEIEKNSLDVSKLCDFLKIDCEALLFNSFYKTNTMLISSLTLLVNDENEFIEWFIYDCRFGKNPLEAGFPTNMKKIDSFEKLKWLIESME